MGKSRAAIISNTVTRLFIYLLVVTAIALAGCSTDTPDLAEDLFDTDWQVTEAGPFDLSNEEVALRLDRDNIVAFDGCNGTSISYSLIGNILNTGRQGPQTLAGCPEENEGPRALGLLVGTEFIVEMDNAGRELTLSRTSSPDNRIQLSRLDPN